MIESSFLFPSLWESDIVDFTGCIPEIPPLDFEEFQESLSSCEEDLVLNELGLNVSKDLESDIFDDSAGFSDLDWLNDSTNKSPSTLKSTEKQSAHALKYKPLIYLQSSNLWSEMHSSEQLETLHALSEIVTFHLGIREQMEVIKIIDPTAVLSPDDTEFALDSSCLNDAKLERIKDFIKSQEFHLQDEPLHNFSNSKKENNSTNLVSRRSNNLSYSRTKRKNKKQGSFFASEDKQLKMKKQKQTRKEQRSGFFVYEKKMKLTIPVEDDEEDINVLE